MITPKSADYNRAIGLGSATRREKINTDEPVARALEHIHPQLVTSRMTICFS